MREGSAGAPVRARVAAAGGEGVGRGSRRGGRGSRQQAAGRGSRQQAGRALGASMLVVGVWRVRHSGGSWLRGKPCGAAWALPSWW